MNPAYLWIIGTTLFTGMWFMSGSLLWAIRTTVYIIVALVMMWAVMVMANIIHLS